MGTGLKNDVQQKSGSNDKTTTLTKIWPVYKIIQIIHRLVILFWPQYCESRHQNINAIQKTIYKAKTRTHYSNG